VVDRAPFPPSSFLAGLTDASLERLIAAGRHLTLADGSSLLFEGDASGRVIVILRGGARVFSTAANGREVLVTEVGAGEILGEMSALDGLPHSASSSAIGGTDVVLVPGEAFRDLLEADAPLATAVARRLTRELRRMMHKRVDLEAFDVPTRLAGCLVQLAEAADGDPPFELEVSQHELAERCGASREAVTKALATFRSRGWVRTGRRSITVVDVEALRSRAG